MLPHPVSLRRLTTFPFMTVTWLSSLPSSPCSPWSTTHHHHQCPTILPQTLDPDFQWGHVSCCITCLASNTSSCSPEIFVWVIHAHIGHGIRKPMPIFHGYEEGISYVWKTETKAWENPLIVCSYYFGDSTRLILLPYPTDCKIYNFFISNTSEIVSQSVAC